jgi:hypothetical protein
MFTRTHFGRQAEEQRTERKCEYGFPQRRKSAKKLQNVVSRKGAKTERKCEYGFSQTQKRKENAKYGFSPANRNSHQLHQSSSV